MLLVNKYDVQIRVNKEVGLYLFNPTSASGKTFLTTLARKYNGFGERINSYTYDDYKTGLNLKEVLTRATYSLFIVDRYDMYFGEALEELKSLGESCIVLIDLKQRSKLSRYANCLCTISLKEGAVVVS